jgi:hypothetical protein
MFLLAFVIIMLIIGLIVYAVNDLDKYPFPD